MWKDFLTLCMVGGVSISSVSIRSGRPGLEVPIFTGGDQHGGLMVRRRAETQGRDLSLMRGPDGCVQGETAKRTRNWG